MKKIIIAAAICASLAGCTTAQVEGLQSGLGNFTTSVASINTAIAQVSTTVATNCTNLQATAGALAGLIGAFTANTKAVGGLSAANAALRTWCSAPPTDIATAVAATAAEISAAKAAYKAAQAGG